MTTIKRAGSQDVARAAGVSRATVSAYINGTRYVSPELTARIERAIKELNYVPDPLARALKMKDAKTIGLVIPVMSRFFAPIINAINRIAHENRYGFLLCSSEEDPRREEEVIRILVAKRISGILVVPCSVTNLSLLRSINDGGVPIVQVNRKIPGLDVDTVRSDNFKAAYTATKHLIDRGRRHLAYLGYDERTLSANEKREGFEAALREHGIAGGTVIRVRDHDDEDIASAFRRFIASGQQMDGLILSTQAKTAVGFGVLLEHSVEIPGRVAVVGFDDTPWSSIVSPPLTVISENTQKMGEIAAALLLERVEGVRTGPAVETVLEDEFIVRKST
jgi:DNA-binding LacI/PurR family transcriptional regulator